MENVYLCIDLKSFYASVECVMRGLDPMEEKLVVADPTRTEKTICLAVSPALKALGVRNRCRVFEIPKNIKYIMAPPRMKLYIDYAAQIYSIYLKYISSDDIFVYSIDEAFLDITDYLFAYKKNARELAVTILEDIRRTTGLRAACGIGSNLYLAKIALDISAKHSPDFIAELDEAKYRATLWEHTPLTDFWRIGRGTAAALAKLGIYNMKQITETEPARLYKSFGVDAELLIDHAWGRESTKITDVKSYKSQSNSLSSSQLLGLPADYDQARLLVAEMLELMSLELVDRGAVTGSITMHLSSAEKDVKSCHGTAKLPILTNSMRILSEYGDRLFTGIVPKDARIKHIIITYNDLRTEQYMEFDMFTDPSELERERKISRTVLELKRRFGKNAVIKGMNLQEGARTIERNAQIGGHRSGEE